MIQEIKFDEVRDIQEVQPGLAMSIVEAMVSGVVKDTIDTSPYTKETDVHVIGNYVTDNIEVAMALKKLGKSLSELPTNTSVQSKSVSEVPTNTSVQSKSVSEPSTNTSVQSKSVSGEGA